MMRIKYYFFVIRWMWAHRDWSDTRQKYKAMNREWKERRRTHERR